MTYLVELSANTLTEPVEASHLESRETVTVFIRTDTGDFNLTLPTHEWHKIADSIGTALDDARRDQ